MLSFGTSPLFRSRRDWLRCSLGAAGGLALPDWILPNVSAPALADPSRLKSLSTGKSVVFVFMHGGPSQFETFDPKPDAPIEIRGTTGAISTQVPGISLGGALPKLAAMADRLTLVRSLVAGNANHDIKTIVGKATADANIGSLIARVLGQTAAGFPRNVAVFPQSVDPATQPYTRQFGDFASAGAFGAAVAPFIPGAAGDQQKNLKLHLGLDRFDDRRQLLTQLDRIRRDLNESPTDPLREQAYETLLGGVADAFDLSKEDPATLARYDTNALLGPSQISSVWNNYNNYCDNAKTLGKLMLLARRLCERNCSFVTVTTNFVWDMHSDSNNAGVEEGMRYMGPPFDHAISTFLQDLEERGLSKQVLLVCCGEMGRTPRINARGGRDHWGNLAPLMLAGGGLPEGHVIGRSTRDGAEPSSAPISIAHLVSTILNWTLNVGELRVTPGIPSEIVRLASHDPISW